MTHNGGWHRGLATRVEATLYTFWLATIALPRETWNETPLGLRLGQDQLVEQLLWINGGSAGKTALPNFWGLPSWKEQPAQKNVQKELSMTFSMQLSYSHALYYHLWSRHTFCRTSKPSNSSLVCGNFTKGKQNSAAFRESFIVVHFQTSADHLGSQIWKRKHWSN